MSGRTSLIIGGGFFGMYIAEYLALTGQKVILCEKENDFMQRASYNNQARVHNGYHYPRSTLTALRSRVSFPVFCKEFADCVDSSFKKYYMIGKILGKVTAGQFKLFCDRIGLYCEEAESQVKKLVNQQFIEEVFSTVEYAFDACKLKNIMISRLQAAGVEYYLDTEVVALRRKREFFQVRTVYRGKREIFEAEQIFNCTYSLLNAVLVNSGIDFIPLKHEMTEMALVEVPEILQDKGITIMCGPFFSVMPFPDRHLHTLSHVRYTPHYEWYDSTEYFNAHQHFAAAHKESAYRKMVYDARRYLPCMADCQYKGSLWEVKTVLPRSEIDDSRPILFKDNYGFAGLHVIMGGKIDNIYDAVEIIQQKGLDK